MSRGNLDAIKADYLKKKGDADTRKENYGDAIKHYTEALQVSPTHTHTHTKYFSFFLLCLSSVTDIPQQDLIIDVLTPSSSFFPSLSLSLSLSRSAFVSASSS